MASAKKTPALPDPKPVEAFSGAGVGKWYAGASPEGGKDRPVLVFVPGLGQFAPSWWGEDEFYGRNDLYQKAFEAGYRTAFVSFHKPGSKPMDMWRNGKILSWQIREICRRFGVHKVILIGHSKGGVDSESAVVYHGAGEHVEKIITLSTPHWGSQLADLAYSQAGWHLAEHIGAHSDGCYVMQTDYMKEYRSLTDSQEIKAGRMGTFAGSGRGPAFTSLWAGTLIMDRFGPNDGVVTVESAQNPTGKHIATLGFNHAQMRMGKFIWPYLEAAVENRPVAVSTLVIPSVCRNCGNIIRGGRLDGGIRETLDVDSSVKSMVVSLTCTGMVSPRLTSPNQTAYTDFGIQPFRNGDRIYQINIDSPEAGRWLLTAPKGKGAFFAYVRFYGENPELCAGESGGEIRGAENVKTSTKIFKIWPDRHELVGAYEGEKSSGGGLHLKSGLYNVETSVKGELRDGSVFDRTLIRSMLVKPGDADPIRFLTGLKDKKRRV